MRRIVVCATVLLAAHVAHADNKVAAEELFEQGKQLQKDGKLAEACDAFGKSQELDPELGTEYNLAICDEQLGKTATAWGLFRELAQRDTNKKRKKDSADRAAKLDGKLTKVLITIEGPALSGLDVQLNGETVTPMIGVATAVDPGTYTLGASAPGYQSFTSTVSASGEGATVTVNIPVLEPVKKEVTTPVVTPPPPAPRDKIDANVQPRKKSARKTIGLVIAGVGLAGVVGGGVFGLIAKGKWSDAEAVCGSDHACDTQAELDRSHSLADSARSAGNLSTALFAGGAAVLATGAILWLTAPSGGAEHAVAIVPTQGGVAVSFGGAL